MRNTTNKVSKCQARLRRFQDSEEGASAVEYVVMVAGIAIGTTMLANTIGINMASTFSKTDDALGKAMNQHQVTTVSHGR